MHTRKLKQFGEVNLVARIKEKLSRQHGVHQHVSVPIGDDAFVGAITRDHQLVSTVDMLIEGVHFKSEWTTPEELGYKAMAVNLSDLAAMGFCRPLYALVSIALPSDTTVDYVDKLYTGMMRAVEKFGAPIVGGDTVSSTKDIVISITLIGEISKKDIITRRGAQPGDIILTTGTLGDSGAGLYLLNKGIHTRGGYQGYLITKHLVPEPRLDAAHALGRTAKITSMIDCSDGLDASLRFLCEESRTGAIIDINALPISRELIKLAGADRCVKPLELAVAGGEDYELIMTAHPKDIPFLKKVFHDLTPVGVMTQKGEIEYHRRGKRVKVPVQTFEHFR